jgi:hypothetical protein
MAPVLPEYRPPSLLLCVLTLGGAGFAAGYFGPMTFAPDANQGPLVGIFLSGPGGAFLGLLLYAFFRLSDISPARQWQALLVSCVFLATVTLYLIMPGPVLCGYIEDVQIESCKEPIEALDDGIKYWDEQFARPRMSPPRAGWKDDSREMLQSDQGVVVGVSINRQKKLYEERKPWNMGHIVAEDWKTVNTKKTYYAQYAGSSCAGYAIGTRSLQFNDLYFYGVPTGLGWPPRKVPNFLNLQTLESVPEKYREFAGN